MKCKYKWGGAAVGDYPLSEDQKGKVLFTYNEMCKVEFCDVGRMKD